MVPIKTTFAYNPEHLRYSSVTLSNQWLTDGTGQVSYHLCMSLSGFAARRLPSDSTRTHLASDRLDFAVSESMASDVGYVQGDIVKMRQEARIQRKRQVEARVATAVQNR